MDRVHLQIRAKGMVLASISSGTREAALEAAKKEAEYFLQQFDSVEIIDRPGRTRADRKKAFHNFNRSEGHGPSPLTARRGDNGVILLTAADLAPDLPQAAAGCDDKEPSDPRRDCPWKCKIGEENCLCMDEREDRRRIRECSAMTDTSE